MIPAMGVHAHVLAAIHAASFDPGQRWGADAMALQLAQPGAFGFLAGDSVERDDADAVSPALTRLGRFRADDSRPDTAPAAHAIGSAGFVLARSVFDEAEILTLAVLPERRREGWGRALLRQALAEAGRRGATAMFLEVAEANRPALDLYASLSFVQVGQRTGYYAGRGDARVMRCALPLNACGPTMPPVLPRSSAE